MNQSACKLNFIHFTAGAACGIFSAEETFSRKEILIDENSGNQSGRNVHQNMRFRG